MTPWSVRKLLKETILRSLVAVAARGACGGTKSPGVEAPGERAPGVYRAVATDADPGARRSAAGHPEPSARLGGALALFLGGPLRGASRRGLAGGRGAGRWRRRALGRRGWCGRSGLGDLARAGHPGIRE